MGAEADPLSDPKFVDAYRSISERRHSTAARQLLRLTRDYPRSAEVWGLLGVASRGLGASAQSLAFFQRAAALRPESGALWLQVAMGGTTLRQGLPRDVLERAARGQPDNATAWLLLGGAQIDEADFSSADESLARAIGLAPSNATAYFLRAYAMGKLGDFEGAEVAAKQCVRLDRKNARAWFYLGLLHTRSGAIQEAIEAFRETVRIDPKHPHAWMNLSKAYLTVGNRTEARVAFDKHRSLPAGKPASERE
jgi:Flp pilus assembly protein TadD